MAFVKRILLFVLINIGLIVSITVLIAILERVFGIRITPNLSNGYVSVAIYSAVFGFSSAFISLAISRMMAKWTYGITPISESRLMDESPKMQVVYTTVAQIARNSQIEMPEVGVYESPEPNAFATGPTKNRALVAVSTGLLDTMRNDEIEGVIGHEMSHVLNGDMVTMTLLQGVLNAIVIFASRVLASVIASALRKDDEGGFSWLQLAIQVVLEIALGFAAMLVLMAFSRYREYRADIGSARLLGKSKMIAALKRLQIVHGQYAGRVETNEQMQALQISSYKLSTVFSSHPALEDRIAALEQSLEVA